MAPVRSQDSRLSGHRLRLHEIIFEADTPAGKLFDVALLVAIVSSVTVVMLESVEAINDRYGAVLRALEWLFTLLFTAEYVVRLYAVQRPSKYALSFFGVVDLLSVLPTYASLFFGATQSLAVIRAFRLLRIFRVLKLAHYVGEAGVLMAALRESRAKITVFLGAVVTITICAGTLIYLIEGGQDSGFTSIPRSVYWAIVTVTTVGYGDIAPQTAFGQVLAAVLMILGYGIIAVPTGIMSAELAIQRHELVSTQACPSCSGEGHDADAEFCKYCGSSL
jgi:voltage-gated potassium channel